jgi:D-aminopeptidase
LTDARNLIGQNSKRAVERAADFKSYRFAPPYTLEWDCSDHNIASMLARVPGAELVQPNTVRYINNANFNEIFNMVIVWRSLLRTATVPN